MTPDRFEQRRRRHRDTPSTHNLDTIARIAADGAPSDARDMARMALDEFTGRFWQGVKP